MIKNAVGVVDVGSSKICVLVGNRGANGSVNVVSSFVAEYDGFSEGSFFSDANLAAAIKKCLDGVSEELGYSLSEYTVCVPGAFIRLENRKYKIVFDKKKKIRKEDVESLKASGRSRIETAGYEVIGDFGIYYATDDNPRVFDPAGCASSSLGGYLNYVLCEKYFIQKMTDVLKKFGASVVGFAFDGLVQSQFLLDKFERESCSMILDVGYISSTASIVLGDGVIAKHSEDFGGGLISYRIFKDLDASSPDVAESIKRGLNLFITDSSDGTYRIPVGDGRTEEYSISAANAAAKEQIDEFLENAASFAVENSRKIKGGLKVYLVGGGLSFVRGAKEYLSEKLGVPVEVLKIKAAPFGKPDKVSALSALDYAIREKDKNRKSIFSFFRG